MGREVEEGPVCGVAGAGWVRVPAEVPRPALRSYRGGPTRRIIRSARLDTMSKADASAEEARADADADEMRSHWGMAAETWAIIVDYGLDPFRVHCLDPYLEKLLPELPAGRWLDLGCGEGTLARQFHALGNEVVGLDAAPEMVELARRRGPDDQRLTFHVGPAEATGLESGSFCGAISKLTSMSITKYDQFVSEVDRLLRPGGLFVEIVVHPCFSGSRSAQEYLCESADQVQIGFGGMKVSVTNFHRPLSRLVGAITRKFVIEELHEPEAGPELFRSEQWGAVGFHGPPFLVLLCRKEGAREDARYGT